ncbi:MAG: hypothetical protein SNJ57_10025 [Cyanobacteriota bacterium]
MTRQNWHRYESGDAEYILLDTLRDMERAIDWDSGVGRSAGKKNPLETAGA